jgi:hypothetical protein
MPLYQFAVRGRPFACFTGRTRSDGTKREVNKSDRRERLYAIELHQLHRDKRRMSRLFFVIGEMTHINNDEMFRLSWQNDFFSWPGNRQEVIGDGKTYSRFEY